MGRVARSQRSLARFKPRVHRAVRHRAPSEGQWWRILARCSADGIYYQRFGACRGISSFSSKTALQHTGHVTRSNFCAVRPQTSLDLNCGPRTHQTSNRSSIGFGDWCRNAFTSWHPYKKIDDLRQQLISVWAEFKQSVIDKAIDQWRPRLRACVRASGLHFKQLSNWSRPNCLSVEWCCFDKATFSCKLRI